MTHSTANMMGVPPREFRIGGVMGTTFNVFLKNIVSFSTIAAVVMLPATVILVFAITAQTPDNPTGSLPGITIAMALFFVLQPFATAIILYSVYQGMRGRSASLSEAISWAMSRLLPLLGLSIVYGLGITAGIFALVIPGLILLTMWAVAIPVCVVEKTVLVDSLHRSSELTKGNRWQVFAILLIVLIASSVINQVVQTVSSLGGFAVFGVILVVMEGISQAFNAVLIAVMYHDLRVSKEGGDINRIASVFD